MTNQGQKTESRVLIIGICGSLREGSYTRMALRVALRGAEAVGAQTQLIDLRDYDLTFCDGEGDRSRYHAGLLELRKIVTQARGIILGTPEYHASFSGVLKNALDLMGFTEFEGKIIGLVGVSAMPTGARNALRSLRSIGRALHAWVIEEEASISEAWKVFGEGGQLKDSLLENQLKEVGRQVAHFATLRTADNPSEFLRLWERAPINPGGSTTDVEKP